MTLNWDAIPQQIQTYKQQILATARQSFQIEFIDAEQLTPWSSKVGGLPYLPQDFDYPYDSNGLPLQLLAQINFSELPANDLYPQQGMLQFYIGGNELYGCDLDQKQIQDGFRVIYFENVIEDEQQLQQDFPEALSGYEDAELFSPFGGEAGMRFKLKSQYISAEDAGILQKIFAVQHVSEAQALIKSENFYDDWLIPYSTFISSENNHRLGGYPYFTQDDPRGVDPKIEDYVLLFQLDSTEVDGLEIMWGDMGVGNFFIHPEDLKKGDFSKVVYNWDCG